MKKTFFLIGVTIAMLSSSFLMTAQTISTDSLKAMYEQETIRLDGVNNQYIKNYKKKKIGIFGKKLNKEFDKCSPEAKEEMGMFMKNEKRTGIFTTSSIVILAGTVTAIAIAPEIIVVPVIVGLSATLIADGIGLVNAIKAQRHLSKAIWLHNRDVLIQK